ncbi:unnamed protein product [Phyllotreta striolata]|uniref:Transmembrane protein 177 n=1 Tax=Phyllotreta striolata TaxID=444603 RepID=A0A9N9TS94_PHYSR|nr:unnamed protein product [Phyllotreta striolata]
MSLQRLSKWLVSDNGKKACYYLAGGLTTSTVFAHFLPQTLLLHKYKEIVQLYQNGFPVEVSEKLKQRFQKVLDILQIDPKAQQLYQPIHVFGFDVFSIGSSFSKFGSFIGLPINFTYEDTRTINTSKLKIREESIIWDSEPAQKLLDSLVLSENAQLYAMAREIKHRQTLKPLLNAALSFQTVFLIYAVSRQINERFNFYAQPRSTRMLMYLLVGAFCGGIHAMGSDASQIYYEGKIDKELRQTDQAFVEGGKEFYEKILQRNKALRSLLGKEGERLYTVHGNENYLIRQKHLPIVQRKSSFEEQLAS